MGVFKKFDQFGYDEILPWAYRPRNYPGLLYTIASTKREYIEKTSRTLRWVRVIGVGFIYVSLVLLNVGLVAAFSVAAKNGSVSLKDIESLSIIGGVLLIMIPVNLFNYYQLPMYFLVIKSLNTDIS